MLSPAVISIILWAPFLVVFLVAAIVFCISGFRKGLWRALISLGITIVSAILSFFLAKIVAGVVAGGIVASITAMLPAGNVAVGMVKPLLPSMVQALLSIAFFAVIFFVITLIGKIVGNLVKKEALLVDDVRLKWGGLGVRVVDAVIYTILLLLPLYGTLGTYAPTVQTVLNFVGGEAAAFSEYIGAVTNHPLVDVSTNSVIGDVYTGLSDASGGANNGQSGGNVNITDVVDVVDDAMEKFEALSSATTDEEFEAACLDLVTHLKDNVIEADWSYDLIQQTTVVLKDEIVNSMTDATPEEIKTVETVVDMLDMSKEEFQENGVVMLDFVEYALKNDVMSSMETGDMTSLQTPEFYQEAATMLNATEKTTEIKKYLISETISGVFSGDTEVANKIMESYDDSAVTTPEAQQAEIKAWLEITTAQSQEELVDALLNIPTLDSNLINEELGKLGAN